MDEHESAAAPGVPNPICDTVRPGMALAHVEAAGLAAFQRLPPELLHKGRSDEIFFVDLPDAKARRQLFELYLGNRCQPVEKFDLEALAATSQGFSGAEMEQAVVSALYGDFYSHGELTTDALLDELSRTRHLSRTKGERLDTLRAWARPDRSCGGEIGCVRASTERRSLIPCQ